MKSRGPPPTCGGDWPTSKTKTKRKGEVEGERVRAPTVEPRVAACVAARRRRHRIESRIPLSRTSAQENTAYHAE